MEETLSQLSFIKYHRCSSYCEARKEVFLGLGGGPGLVVRGGDSCSRGCGFKSQHRILDRHFSHLFVIKIVFVYFQSLKGTKKRTGVANLKRSFFLEVIVVAAAQRSPVSKKQSNLTSMFSARFMIW